MKDLLLIQTEVRDALCTGRPVVALESTIISHGLPWPDNLTVALAIEEVVRERGAVPATVGLDGGRILIGMARGVLERFARNAKTRKASRRDIAVCLAQGATGATTVAATMVCAAAAGIRLFATGGIGGVHRGVAETLDISADLEELARTPVAVVCAGAKSILDLPKTLEYLETHGVPVIGYRTNEFPAFHCRESDLAVDVRLDEPLDVARVLSMRDRMALGGGEVIANPIPIEDAVSRGDMDRWLADAFGRAQRANVRGKEITPFLLAVLAEVSSGRSVASNRALVLDNARVAADIACAYCSLTRHEP